MFSSSSEKSNIFGFPSYKMLPSPPYLLWMFRFVSSKNGWKSPRNLPDTGLGFGAGLQSLSRGVHVDAMLQPQVAPFFKLRSP